MDLKHQIRQAALGTCDTQLNGEPVVGPFYSIAYAVGRGVQKPRQVLPINLSTVQLTSHDVCTSWLRWITRDPIVDETREAKCSKAVVPAFCRRWGAKATYWTSAIQLLDDHPGGPPGHRTPSYAMICVQSFVVAQTNQTWGNRILMGPKMKVSSWPRQWPVCSNHWNQIASPNVGFRRFQRTRCGCLWHYYQCMWALWWMAPCHWYLGFLELLGVRQGYPWGYPWLQSKSPEASCKRSRSPSWGLMRCVSTLCLGSRMLTFHTPQMRCHFEAENQ